MAKRYHDSKKGMKHEAVKRNVVDADMDKERMNEKRDSRMIGEDHKAIANCPQGVVYRPWAENPEYQIFPNLDDTISGIDHQMEDDAHGPGMKRGSYPKKY